MPELRLSIIWNVKILSGLVPYLFDFELATYTDTDSTVPEISFMNPQTSTVTLSDTYETSIQWS